METEPRRVQRGGGKRRRHRERGSVLFELPLIFGLVLVPFGMLIISAPTWVERQTAARDAAAESARYLLLNGEVGGRSPEQIVREVEAGYGLPEHSLTLEILRTDIQPGESLTVRVTVLIPAVSLPIFGGIGAVEWTAEHTERLPDFGATR